MLLVKTHLKRRLACTFYDDRTRSEFTSQSAYATRTCGLIVSWRPNTTVIPMSQVWNQINHPNRLRSFNSEGAHCAMLDDRVTSHAQIEVGVVRVVYANLMGRHHYGGVGHIFNQQRASHRPCIHLQRTIRKSKLIVVLMTAPTFAHKISARTSRYIHIPAAAACERHI